MANHLLKGKRGSSGRTKVVQTFVLYGAIQIGSQGRVNVYFSSSFPKA